MGSRACDACEGAPQPKPGRNKGWVGACEGGRRAVTHKHMQRLFFFKDHGACQGAPQPQPAREEGVGA